jgi:hypothetical protein
VTIMFDKATPTTIKLALAAPAGSDLKVPIEITAAVRSKQATFDLTAGSKEGEYAIKVTPSKGTPIEVKVTVK